MSSYQLACVLLLCVVGLVVAKPVPPRISLSKLIEEALEEPTATVGGGGVSVEDCQEYCSHSYPEHTYPNPNNNNKACVSGCRSAQLDALIFWPYQPSQDSCSSSCLQAYSNEEESYACLTGCKASTIDTAIPSRELVYFGITISNSTTNITESTEDNLNDIWSLLFGSLFDTNWETEFDHLTEHANKLAQIVPPVRSSKVTYILDDEVILFEEFSFSNDADSLSSSNIYISNDEPDSLKDYNANFIYSAPGQTYKYYNPSAGATGDAGGYQTTRCRWLRHRTVFGRFLLCLSVGLIMVALGMCCLSSLTGHSNEHEQKKPQIPQTHVHCPSSRKEHLILGAPSFVPVKVQLNTDAGKIKTVEGVLTVA